MRNLLPFLLLLLQAEAFLCFTSAQIKQKSKHQHNIKNIASSENSIGNVVSKDTDGQYIANSNCYQDNRHDDIVDKIVDHFQNVTAHNGIKRGNVQLPPGWGKTQLALQTLERLVVGGVPSQEKIETAEDDRKIHRVRSAIYVTPFLKLVDQVLDHMERFGTLSEVPHSRLIVASQTNRKREKCTTSINDIAEFMMPLFSQSNNDKHLHLIITTYNSLPKVGEAMILANSMSAYNKNNNHDAKMSIGFGIFDEAHIQEGIGERSGYGLDDALLPIDYRLFLTATPRRYVKSPSKVEVWGTKQRKDGSRYIIPRKLKNNNNTTTNVRSITDEKLFGPCIERRTSKESVEQNVTLPTTLVALDRDEIYSALCISNHSPGNKLTKDSLIALAVRAAFRKLNVSRAISFHSLNARARGFVKTAKDILDEDGIHACNVDGTMPVGEREKVIQEAKKANKSIIANCRVLATGVDEADWDMVVMADPVLSPVASRQMIGRVNRKAPGKERGYVLVPLLIDAYTSDGSTDSKMTEEYEDSLSFDGYSIFVCFFV